MTKAVVPIGETMRAAINLHLTFRGDFKNWLTKRSRKIKPKIKFNLLPVVWSHAVVRQVQGIGGDFESIYSEIYAQKHKLERLTIWVCLHQVGTVVILYICLFLALTVGTFAVITISKWGGIWLGLVSATLLTVGCGISFYSMIQSLQWTRFAALDLVCNPDRKVEEVGRDLRQLLRNFNIDINWLDFLANLVIANISIIPILILITISSFFSFRGVMGYGVIGVSLAVMIYWLREIYYFRSTLNAYFYYKLRCLREGWDLSLRGKKMEIERKVKLLTPENVELEFNLAGIGNRALALLIDYGILFLVLLCLYFVWFSVNRQLEESNASNELTKWFNALMFILFFVIYTGYFVYFETVWNGQTPGKRFTKIRVIKADGRPLGLQQASLRALLRPFDDFFSLGVLFIIFHKTEKRIGDIVAQTIVIQEPRRPLTIAIDISNNGHNAKKEWTSLGVNDRLTIQDFAVVKDYLQRRHNFSAKARSEVSDRLLRQLQDKLDIREIPLGFTADEHLEAIYLSYTKYES